MIENVIFDMDGTLLDTETIFRDSWIMTSKKWNIDSAEELYENIAGRSADTIKLLFEEKYGDRYDFDKFFSERMACFCDLVKDNIPLKPGAEEILMFLKENNIPCALATSTPMHMTDPNLKRAGLYDYFSVIVTSESVQSGKPAPDIFLEAAKRLGAVADRTIVVEDSYNGLLAAYRANIRPVMVVDRQLPNDEIRKILYAECNSLFDVIKIIKKEI